MQVRQGSGAWDKDPMSQDITERIKQQTNENIQRRLRDQLAEAQQQLELSQTEHLKDRLRYEAELEDALKIVDTLLDFIAQRADELPVELLEVIAVRQEQRIERALPREAAAGDGQPNSANAVVVVGGAGQVLRMVGGQLSWGGRDLASTDVVTSGLPTDAAASNGTVEWAPASVLKRLHELLNKYK